jgi:hypothetical protein
VPTGLTPSARAGEPQRPRHRVHVLRVGVRQARCTRCALTKAQSGLRLDKACVYLASHQLIEHPVPARMHLRGKLSQVRGFIVRAKTKSRDQVCRNCCDFISVRIEEWQSHREALDLPTVRSYDASAAILKALAHTPAEK